MHKASVYSRSLWLAGVISLAVPAAAQNTNRFIFGGGAGYTQPIGITHGRLDPGFNLEGHAGVNLAPAVGVVGEFSFNQLGVPSSVLQNAGVPDGAARIYAVTLNPIIRFAPGHRAQPYIIGGGGYYRRTVELTQPTLATATVFDPFYGVFFPATVVTNAVVSSFTQNKGGWNAGAGVTFALKGDSNAKFFAEARYTYIYTTPTRTTMVPITFGFRW